MRIGLYLGAAALAITAPAAAEWQQASSKHFLIYGDMTTEEMKVYAAKLEMFDAAARLVRKQNDPVVGDGNRVQVFVVPSLLEVNRLYGAADSGIGGYYVGSVAGPFIVTPRKSRQILDYRKLEPETVFFHEYTHHLQLQDSNRPMPTWLVEGFAEFLANPIFGADGSIGLGTPATHRAEQLLKGRWAPIEDLISGDAISIAYNGFWIQNYAQGWLMNHYLAFEPSRKGQIDAYTKRIAAGENSLTAAKAVFGDLGQLEAELRKYVHSKHFPYLKIDSTKLKIAPVVVTQLSPGAAEAMPIRMHIKTGYGSVSTGYALTKMKDIAKRFPNDGLVQRTLAEAAYDNKDYALTEVAADAALKIEPKSTEAMIYKGRAYLGRARKSKSAEEFKHARQWFLAANKADHEDPEPLYLFYRTYRLANQSAPQGAIDALTYATLLAPRDNTPAAELVVEYLRQNKLKQAADALRPIAYAPDLGQSKENKPYSVLKLIEAGNRDAALKLATDELLPKEKDDRS